MPHKVNGTGTWYHFPSNHHHRDGVCEHCHRPGRLASYDTGLWFVVLEIPILPLGKKRVIDECPFCRMHSVVPLEKWRQIQAESDAQAMEAFKNDPTAESALGVHGRLLAFHDFAKADAFRAQSLAFFEKDGEFLSAMGAQLEQAGRDDDAESIYKRVLSVTPDDSDANAFLGARCAKRGEFDVALDHLGFLLQPGAGAQHSMAPLATLAIALSAARRDEEVLKICERVVAEEPAFVGDDALRAACHASERRLGRSLGIFPEKRRSFWEWLGFSEAPPHAHPALAAGSGPPSVWQVEFGWWIALAALALIGGGLWNEWVRQNHRLHVVNAFRQTMVVRLDDGPPVQVPPGRQMFTLVEGPHRIEALEPIQDAATFEITLPYWRRFLSRPLLTYAPGGSAVLLSRDVVYSSKPKPAENYKLLPCEGVTKIEHVDYAFVDPPESISVKHTSGDIRRVWVDRLPVEPAQAAVALFAQDFKDPAIRLLETHLRAAPDDRTLVDMYQGLVSACGREGAGAKFLEARLTLPETSVEWHRAWSHFASAAGEENRVREWYDAALAQAPDDARWLYLRGRVEEDPKKEATWYRKSIKADPFFSWPHIALAHRAAMAADWKTCAAECDQARRLNADVDTLVQLERHAQWALRAPADLVEEANQALADNPYDVEAATRLCAARALSDLAAAREAWAAFEAKLAESPESDEEDIADARVEFLLAIDDFEGAAVEVATNPRVPGFRRALCAALEGRAAEAEQTTEFQVVASDAFGQMALAVGHRWADRPEEAEACLTRVAEMFERQGADARRAAAIVRSKKAPSVKALKRVSMSIRDKALFATLIACRHPDRVELRDFVRKLNVDRDPVQRYAARLLEHKTRVAAESTKGPSDRATAAHQAEE